MEVSMSVRLRPRLEWLGVALALVLSTWSSPAQAFCGFFVGKADATLFNNASQVVVVHDEGKTVLTMVNNYRGEPKAFALVVPVPVVLQKGLVRVTEMKAIDQLDGFSAPRLAEYYDPDPCEVMRMRNKMAPSAAGAAPAMEMERKADKKTGVTVEASYTVGEYDIVILSATESDGLETWLRQNQYNIPKGAAGALKPYVTSGMKFFVAKVNIKEQQKAGFTTLRPLQFAFPDKRFMLPIRLGMLNADGPQDLIAYVITKQFRVETANYVNPRLPSDVEVPTYIKGEFKSFYRSMFGNQVAKENGRAVFTEYAWNMAWCDPCAADPLSNEQLQQLGVWWVRGQGGQGGAQQAFVTRLHAQYTPQTFPEDLMLKVTKDSSNYQARYVLRHPFTGAARCEAFKGYKEQVLARREKESQTLANLTSWRVDDIRRRQLPLPAAFGSSDNSNPEDDGWNQQMQDMFKQ
jgi:hypothetical protein